MTWTIAALTIDTIHGKSLSALAGSDVTACSACAACDSTVALLASGAVSTQRFFEPRLCSCGLEIKTVPDRQAPPPALGSAYLAADEKPNATVRLAGAGIALTSAISNCAACNVCASTPLVSV